MRFNSLKNFKIYLFELLIVIVFDFDCQLNFHRAHRTQFDASNLYQAFLLAENKYLLYKLF